MKEAIRLITLILLDDPLSDSAIKIQYGILNSDRYFLNNAAGKNELSKNEIIIETEEYLRLGTKFYLILYDHEPIGMIHFLPFDPYSGCCWLSLFMLHKHKQKNGIGYRSYQLLEETLKQQYNVDKIRLCVQVQNRKGVQFWQRNGFKEIGYSIDNNGLDIHLYEKVVQ